MGQTRYETISDCRVNPNAQANESSHTSSRALPRNGHDFDDVMLVRWTLGSLSEPARAAVTVRD
jgi:hypothetical protein